MTRPTSLTIDLAAIRANVALTRKRAPQSKLLACVKADAYGHGLVQVAKAIVTGVDAFGVANIEEALVLRRSGIDSPILLLEGVFQADELDEVVANDLWITVHSQYQVEMLECLATKRPIQVWLKMDTGMHRLGFSPADYKEAYGKLSTCSAVGSIVHMTHFACADEPENSITTQQLEAFQTGILGLPGERSVANSATILSREDAHFEWVRPGFMLYGASPFIDPTMEVDQLTPAMHFSAAVIAVREIQAGDAVGYNHSWRATRDTRVAVIAAGYGDGYPRNTASGTVVLVGDQPATTIGHVAMDMILVDVTALRNVHEGTPVELWGKKLSVNEVAASSGFSSYELMTRMTGRVPRTYENR